MVVLVLVVVSEGRRLLDADHPRGREAAWRSRKGRIARAVGWCLGCLVGRAKMEKAVALRGRAYHRRLAQLAHHVAGGEEAETDVDTDSQLIGSARAIAGKAKNPEAAMRSALESGKIPDLSVGADGRRLSEKLPGPLQDRDKAEVLLEIGRAEAAGTNHTQWMEWQEQYGDAGLESNIVIPHIVRERVGTEFKTWYTEKVMLSNPDDCIRIARAHTQKQPNFQIFMGDSVQPPPPTAPHVLSWQPDLMPRSSLTSRTGHCG